MQDNGAGYLTIKFFSIANPVGPGQEDVPKLIRSLATTLELKAEQLGPLYIQDITYDLDGNGYGFWPSLTVYFDLEDGFGVKNKPHTCFRREKSMTRIPLGELK